MVALVVLDSVGIGEAPDAAAFGDAGAATVPHVAAAVGGLALPHLGSLGLGRLADIPGVPPEPSPVGAYGTMVERSPGKDTTTGHWEIAGVVLPRPFPTYPQGFPAEVIAEFERRAGVATLGNVAASGTEIIERLGSEHMRTGRPIVYTSADSVFQIAAHVDVIAAEKLYELCALARGILSGEHEVGRVIARPFTGAPGSFIRTQGRRDFAVLPPPTVLDELVSAGHAVVAVGKVADIFCGRGISQSRPASSNDEAVDEVVAALGEIDAGLVFANLVDFDQSYGHRNDPAGYASCLEAFDARLPEIMDALEPDDAVIVTADHGNDPTTPSTDHSREVVPLLCGGPRCRPVDLGVRETFADCGASIAHLLGARAPSAGSSFAAAAFTGA